MSTSKSYNLWIETGYKQFAELGSNKLSIKSLSEACGLQRTSFYYYFEDKDELIDKLIEHHIKVTLTSFKAEIQKNVKQYAPDLFIALNKYKIGLMFAKQLFLNRQHKKFDAAYKKNVIVSADVLVPKFKVFFKDRLSDNITTELWLTLVDTWYSRLDFNNFSAKSLEAVHYEIMTSLKPFTKNPLN